MKNRPIILLLFWLQTICAYAQYAEHPYPQYPQQWNAQWITHPEIDKTAYGLIHFRKEFQLETFPDTFIVHVSGDNRYRLYLNEQEVVYGPQLGDMRHWRYESVDLAPYLQKGRNVLAVEVMNWGVERSYGIVSFKTAFLLQGHSAIAQLVNTGNSTGWKVHKNEGMHEKTVHWRGSGEIVGGFYAANPTDSVVAKQYPWGWSALSFDDDDWLEPSIVFSRPKTNAGAGHGWILQPRTTKIQTTQKEAFTSIARTSLSSLSPDFSFGQAPLEIPPNSRHTLLIDQGYVTLGYPKLILSGGKDAHVQVKYSEALYDAKNQKGNRNEIKGKVIKGISDVYVMDGKDNRVFQPMWFRTFRFVQIEIETKADPLRIEDFHNVFAASEFPVRASFKTDNPLYESVWDICWHALKICAQDNLLSDAYYEQMQYVGDLRPHLKGWSSLTGDLSYFRSAMEQFNNSRLPDGNITSCYPLKATFVHPTYSLIWIDMLHDWMMLEGDKASIEQYTGEIQEVFDYYESLINEQGLVGKSKYHMFVDWYVPKGGNSPVNKDGNSAILTLNYAYTLQHASEIMDWLGYREKAAFYREQSRKYAEITRKLCFDEVRGIYADDPAHTFYDQRASILAVLCGAHDKKESKNLLGKALEPSTRFDGKANLFYYFYLFEAMQKTGVGDFTEQLTPWKKIVEMGLTGTPEKRIEQNPRSEVHPWTAHPVHYYFEVVAGIKPTQPGFSHVAIAPNLGKLKKLNGVYPTVKGDILLNMSLENGGKLEGEVILPEGVQGVFRWKGEGQTLTTGTNVLRSE